MPPGSTQTGTPQHRLRRSRVRQVALEEVRRERDTAVRRSNIEPPMPAAAEARPHTSDLRTRAYANAVAARGRYGGSRRGPSRMAASPRMSASSNMHRLNEVTSSLSSLLDQPIPRLGSPDIHAREYSGEAEVNRRRAKKRRLDNDHLTKGFKKVNYHYRGEVVPGPLRMEIYSCDGGIHGEAASNGRDYSPDNVLRNDKSVYCTERDQCNIIMHHQEAVPFCLTKLVIKAPERGFTAPYAFQVELIHLLPAKFCPSRARLTGCSPAKI